MNPKIGNPNDRWPKRVFRHGFERTGTWFSFVDENWVIPEGCFPTKVEEFLGWIGFQDCSPFPEKYPDRPMISGRQRVILETRLRRLWDALSDPDRLSALDKILVQIQPVWRARAIWLLPVTADEKSTLQGRWCRDTDPRFPKPETAQYRVKSRYEGVDDGFGMPMSCGMCGHKFAPSATTSDHECKPPMFQTKMVGVKPLPPLPAGSLFFLDYTYGGEVGGDTSPLATFPEDPTTAKAP